MKQTVSLVLVMTLLLVVANVPESAQEAVASSAKAVDLVVAKPAVSISAPAYGVFDLETGELLFGADVTTTRPIASITKLFTAAAVLSVTHPETITVVTESDVATEGRAGKLSAGQTYTLHELLFPLLLESSNDAATTLQRSLGEVRYGEKVFFDGSGLSDRNQASVSELSYLLRTIYQTEPHILDITTLPQYIGTHTGWINNSPVLSMEGYMGGKHGYTTAAGRTLAAVFTEEVLGGRPLLCIVLGSDDLKTDVDTLRAAVKDSVQLQ